MPFVSAARPLTPWIRLGALVLVSAGCSLPLVADKEDCPEEFECVLVTPPLDHDNPGETIEVIFAVRPADGVRTGVLVTAVGGPGASGLEAAAWEPQSMDPAILETFDLVYFDQRGLRSLREPARPRADTRYGEGYADLPVEDPQRWDGLIELSSEYSEGCAAESGGGDLLPYLGTEQVARDLEMFRRLQGYETMVIYGQSYGTAVAQEYAELFGDRVKRLVLDGPLDRSLDSLQLLADQATGLEIVTRLMFDACDADPVCAGDMGIPAAEAYNGLIDELLERPRMVRFPIAPGKFEDTPLLAEDVTYLAFANSYFEGDRMIFLRALAAALRGDDIPMLRLYASSGIGLSSMVNMAVSCLDGSIPGDDPPAELDTVTATRRASPPELRWLYEIVLSCVDWPGVDPATPPSGDFAGGAIPTLVVTAEADPATPHHRAIEMTGQFADGRLLEVRGGSHVMFGRGVSCVDDHVTRFILEGEAPDSAECAAPVVEPYVPLVPVEAGTGDLLTAIDNDLAYLPELLFWDGYSFIEVACSHGGSVGFTGTDLTTDFLLDGCAFRPDLVLDGEGRWDYEHGRTELTVLIEGDPCTYEFTQRWDETGGHVVPGCP